MSAGEAHPRLHLHFHAVRARQRRLIEAAHGVEARAEAADVELEHLRDELGYADGDEDAAGPRVDVEQWIVVRELR